MFKSATEDSRPKILFTKLVPIGLLTYPECSKPDKDRLALDFAMQFGEVAADEEFFRSAGGNINFF